MSPQAARAIGARRVVVIGTGAIGVCHLPTLVTLLRRHCGVETAVCLTESAHEMVSAQVLAVMSGRPVIPHGWTGAERPIHVDWSDWAEAVVVWPATLHFLARCAAGLTGDVPTNIVVGTRAPVVLAPSVPGTAVTGGPYLRAVRTLEQDGMHIVGPVAGHQVSTWEVTDGACAPLEAVVRRLAAVTAGLRAGGADPAQDPPHDRESER
ncbi:MAG TPA: flavoprotein [Pseudonocardia sp.]|nr:flavoprotein [Pseudonocardia sp.]